MKVGSAVWLIIMLTMPASVALAGGLTLAEHGASRYRIIIPAAAIPSERYAAEELQRYIKGMTGAQLPILTDDARPTGDEILLGNNARLRALRVGIDTAALGKEGFVLRTLGRRLCIVGGRPRGTLYGVYTFLEEQCGVRWFTPEVESVPRYDRLQVPALQERHVPTFEYREVYWTEAMRDPDFAARLRLNGDHYDLQAKHGGRGVYIFPFVHTLKGLIPPELYDDHPDYFPLVDGKRVRDPAQRCLSNPAVVQLAIARAREWARDEDQATIISISQNDGGNWCQCPQCRALDEAEGSHAASMLMFVNRIAEALEPEFPRLRFETLAYDDSRTPPATIRPRRNVIVRLCADGCCFAHPLAACPSEGSRRFRADLAAWARITNRLYVWDYTTNFHNYLQPFPNLGVLQANIRTFARYGVNGVFEEGNYSPGGGGELAPLRTYLLARLLWNPEMDVARETQAFLQAYYGKAAPGVAAYLALLQQQVQSPDVHAFADDPPTAAYLNDGFLAQAQHLLTAAEAQADDDATRARVQQLQLGLWYVELDTHYARGIRLTDLYRRFFTLARQAGITHISEAITLDDLARHVGME